MITLTTIKYCTAALIILLILYYILRENYREFVIKTMIHEECDRLVHADQCNAFMQMMTGKEVRLHWEKDSKKMNVATLPVEAEPGTYIVLTKKEYTVKVNADQYILCGSCKTSRRGSISCFRETGLLVLVCTERNVQWIGVPIAQTIIIVN